MKGDIMKKLFKEFKDFINKGNALALAIGVIIGGAFTSIVTTINKQIISPLIGYLCGDADLSQSFITVLNTTTDAETGETIIVNAIYWGAFIQAVIDFLLTALILFLIFKVASSVANAAKRAAEKAKDMIKEEEKVEEQVVVEEPVVELPKEPTLEEKQLALLESINENLQKLNSK